MLNMSDIALKIHNVAIFVIVNQHICNGIYRYVYDVSLYKISSA
jgi:hypothetical protein